MKRGLDFHPLVNFDPQAARLWHKSIEPRLAIRLRSALEKKFEELSADALLYNVRFGDIRRVNPPVFQYGIFYFVTGDLVVVLGVLHAARDSEEELRQRRQRYE